MGQTTIEWTSTPRPDGTYAPGYTFNPWHGCVKVSAGCQRCYAETLSHRWGHDFWGVNKPRRMMSESYWQQPLKWNREAEHLGERRKVFCASMADVFEDRPDLIEPRARLWRLIKDTPCLDWLLLTKRPEHLRHMIPWLSVANAQHWSNVWLGTTCENQEQADKRIPHLLQVPVAVRFLSCEPMLGPVDLESIDCFPRFDFRPTYDYYQTWLKIQGFESDGKPIKLADGIDWVICGGESGHGARPIHPDWARSLRDQCEAAGVPFLFKQWGEYAPINALPPLDELASDEAKRERMNLFSAGRRGIPAGTTPTARDGMYRVGKKAGGRLLDGREWNEFPKVEVPA